MTNKEKLKKIIDEDFNKEKNYNEIMNRVNKKNSYLKYSFVPFCIAIITISIIVYNRENKLQGNKPIRNDMIIDTINNMDEEFKTEVYDGKEYNHNEVSTSSFESSYVFDISDPQKVYENTDYVVKIKVKDIGIGTFKYTPSLRPTTPIYVDAVEVLKGNNDEKIDMILKWGGTVTVKEVIENSNPTSIKKQGLDKLTEKEQKTKYIKYIENGDYELEKGKTYVVLLKKSKKGEYFLSSNGYNIFSYEDDAYINVITGKKLVLD